jgi:hypothetical protein
MRESCRCATAFHQKHMEVGGHRFGVKLPHHQCDLTPMVSGMVRQMLHQVRQTDVRRAKRNQFLQGFNCQTTHELCLFFLNFRPLQLHRSNVGECIRIEQRVSSGSQICQDRGAIGRFLPICKPTPFAGDDVQERVSHGTKAAAQIPRELLVAERGSRLQNPVVRPAVLFVQQLNVISMHGDWRLTLSPWGILRCPGIRQNPKYDHFYTLVTVPSNKPLFRNRIREEWPTNRPECR